MAIENDPSARMQLRSRGQLVAPACCMVCGSSDTERAFLDLGVFIDFHGTCYLCELCLTQAAEILGMFTADQVSIMSTVGEKLLTEKEQLAEELRNVTEHRDALNNALRLAFSNNVSADAVANVEASEGLTDREPESEESITFDEPEPVGGSKLRNITFE